jgi:hypothetical protein
VIINSPRAFVPCVIGRGLETMSLNGQQDNLFKHLLIIIEIVTIDFPSPP